MLEAASIDLHAADLGVERQDEDDALRQEALEERSRTNYVPSYYFALIHAALGDKDRALDWLERAYQERSTVLAYLRIGPRLAPLRSDPRYLEWLVGEGKSSPELLEIYRAALKGRFPKK